jgi:hypothetical protein
MKTISVLIVIALTSTVSAMHGQSAAIRSAAETPILIELFTSEGCSSCPPADALLEQMDTSQPVSGAQLIVLSEHVNYWDHDGWKDPYSSSSATERQNEYVRALGLKTAYTPQFIVDGASEFRMGSTAKSTEVFQKAMSAGKVRVNVSSPIIEGTTPPTLRTRVEIDGSSERHNADVYVAVALDHAESQVLRGENGGKHLRHVAVVEQLKRVGKLEKGGSFSQDLDLKLKPGMNSANVRIIVFVQEPGPGRVVGVASQKAAN